MAKSKKKKQPLSESARIHAEEEEKRRQVFKTGSKFLATERSDVVGIDGLLEEADRIIDWVDNADFYYGHEVRLEPGVIFYGSPGTGKTLISRYIATQTDALFVDVRDWPYRWATPTADDISALFQLARKTYAKNRKPIILFWDEFETVAQDRGKAQPSLALAVSQLTAELDGIEGKNEGILLIGCTNYITQIDQALMRPGRMGHHLYFRSPDRHGKSLLLEHYLTPYKTGELDYWALSGCFTASASAAEIEEACRMAWHYSVLRAGKERSAPRLLRADVLEVFVRRLIGHEIDFVHLNHKQRLAIAVHEGGHALVALAWGIPLLLVTVRAGASSLGKVMVQIGRAHV